MNSTRYNNPMFANSLAGLVQNLIGDPSKQAAAEEAASRALLNNQTAQYREAIGDTGLSGDLAAMMIRALQAGPDYSAHAPRIGDAAIRMGSMGFGRPELTPSNGIAALVSNAMRGRAARAPAAAPAAAPAPRLTASASTALQRAVRDAGYEGAENAKIVGSIIGAYQSGQYPTLEQAAAAVLPNVTRETVEVPDPTNRAGTALGRLFGTAPEGYDTKLIERLVIPGIEPASPSAGIGAQDAGAVLQEARRAIASGKDPNAVARRLQELGIDPSQL